MKKISHDYDIGKLRLPRKIAVAKPDGTHTYVIADQGSRDISIPFNKDMTWLKRRLRLLPDNLFEMQSHAGEITCKLRRENGKEILWYEGFGDDDIEGLLGKIMSSEEAGTDDQSAKPLSKLVQKIVKLNGKLPGLMKKLPSPDVIPEDEYKKSIVDTLEALQEIVANHTWPQPDESMVTSIAEWLEWEQTQTKGGHTPIAPEQESIH